MLSSAHRIRLISKVTMKTRQQFVDAFHAAMQLERELWDKVNGHGPGQPGFDSELWTKWMEAVSRTTATAKALREAFADTTSTTSGKTQ
jgi:hypothetical protein